MNHGYKFNGNKYTTKGINESLPYEMQVFLWHLVDVRVSDESIITDYLQVFDITPSHENAVVIVHSQEEPEKIEKIVLNGIYIDEPCKIFVIDDISHVTMLYSFEY